MKTFIISPELSKQNLYNVLEFVFETDIKKQHKISTPFKPVTVDYSFVLPHNKQLVFVNFISLDYYVEYDKFINEQAHFNYCHENNIRLVRIPYFIQLNNYNFTQYFGMTTKRYLRNKKLISIQNSGFFGKENTLPYNFNTYGTYRFLDSCYPFTQVLNGDKVDDSAEFYKTTDEIYASIWNRNEKEQYLMWYFLKSCKDINSDVVELLLPDTEV